MSEKELSKEESLALISDMISQAKRNVARGGSFYFLLWGWVVLFANLGHYVIEKFELFEHPYIVWLITIPAAIASMMRGSKSSRDARVKSHLNGIYRQIWLAVSIGIVITLVFMKQVNFNVNPIILMLAATGTFISGSLLRFNPLIMGAVALWLASIVAYSVSIMDQNLVGAVGILAGYLVPGYLLKKAESERI
ncbi:MAG: hypothetical protein ABJG78_04770 [Cyclobacteriaceae bacterium]